MKTSNIKYHHMLSIIIFLIFVVNTLLIADITPPSPFPYNHKVDKEYLQFDKTITPGLSISNMIINNTYDYNISSTPLRLTLDNEPSQPNCVDYTVTGIVQASLSVGNIDYSTNIDEKKKYSNAIYEHGKQYIDLSTPPINSFKYDISVEVKVTSMCYSTGSDCRTYTLLLEINSQNNNVKNVKVVNKDMEDASECHPVGSPPKPYTIYYVSSIKVLKRDVLKLNYANIYLELNADYERKTHAINSGNPSEPILQIDWSASSTDNVIGLQEYDLTQMNQTDFENSTLSEKYKDLFKWKIRDDMSCADYVPYLFQVQILRLYNTLDAYKDNQQYVYAKVDWSKALTIETRIDNANANLEFKLKDYIATEGTGYYIWRVRPIGNYYPGGLANPLNYGLWCKYVQIDQSTSPTPTPVFTRNAYEDNDVIDIYFDGSSSYLKEFAYFIQIDQKLNWIHSRVFTEGENNQTQFHDVMQYYDNLLRPRQTQRRLPSQDNIILQQNILDFQGRSTLQSLPIAIKQAGLFQSSDLTYNTPIAPSSLKYRRNVFENDYTGITEYSRNNFDLNYGETNSLTSGLLNQYYQSINSQLGNGYVSTGLNGLNIPSAEGFPFTRTILSNDGLNRVIEQSLPGATHKIYNQASASERMNAHTIRNYYSNASEKELVALFGIEAPNPQSISKDITIDPNNIISYTYKDSHGKVIATALKYDIGSSFSTDSPPPSMTNLVQLDNDPNTQIFDEVISNDYSIQRQNGNKFIVSANVNIPNMVTSGSANILLKYEIKPFTYTFPDCSGLGVFSSNLHHDARLLLNQHLDGSNAITPAFEPSLTLSTPFTGFLPTAGTPINVNNGVFGDNDAYSEINILNPNEIKNQLSTVINNNIQNNIINRYKIDNLLSLIEETKNDLITNPTNFDNIWGNSSTENTFIHDFEDFKIGTGTDPVWFSTDEGGNKNYEANINGCFKLQFYDLNCFDCDLKDTTERDYAKELLLGIYKKFQGKRIYYTDNTLTSPGNRTSFVFNINNINSITADEKKQLNYFFYQYGYRLNSEYNGTSFSDVFNVYYGFNRLIKNLREMGEDFGYNRNIVCAELDKFINDFPYLVRESNKKDVLDEKVSFGDVNYIDNDINTLDVFLNRINKTYHGKSSNYADYMCFAFLYYKEPTLSKRTDPTLPAIPSGYTWDALEKYDATKYTVDECAVGSTANNTKIFETRYIRACGEVTDKDKIAQIKQDIEDANQKKNSKDTDQSKLNAALDEVAVKNGLTQEDRNALTKLMDKIAKGATQLTSEDCNTINKLNGVSIQLCDAKRIHFNAALRKFLHKSSVFVEDEDKDFISDLPVTPTPREMTTHDANTLLELLVADCKRYMNVETTYNATSGECEVPGGTSNFVAARKKFMDALVKNKEFTIEKIYITNKLNKQTSGITIPTLYPSNQGDQCFFEANIQENNLIEYVALNHAKEISLLLNKKVQDIIKDLSPEIKNQNNPITRTLNYKTIIDYLETVLAQPKYSYLENLLKMNATHAATYNASMPILYKLGTTISSIATQLYDTDPLWGKDYSLSSDAILESKEFNYFKINEFWDNYYLSDGYGWTRNVKYKPLRNALITNLGNYASSYFNSWQSNNVKQLTTAGRAFLLRTNTDSYYYNYVFKPLARFDERNFPKNLIPYDRDYPYTSPNFTHIFSGGLAKTARVIPINFYLEQKQNNVSVANFNFESINLHIKDGATSPFDCSSFSSTLTDVSANISGITCHIVYHFKDEPISDAVFKEVACRIQKLDFLKEQVITRIAKYRDTLTNNAMFAADYYIKNLDKNVSQTITVNQHEKMHHFTLYYYDRAGNLVRTVPPKGVRIFKTGTTLNTRSDYPPHEFVTFYKYNSKGQVIQSDSPDESIFNKFIYSRLGHLKFSQSARQALLNSVSYIRYDRFMRVIENGEIRKTTSGNILSSSEINSNIENKDFPSTIPTDFVRTFVIITNYSDDIDIPGYYYDITNRTFLDGNKVNHRIRDEDGDLNTRRDQVGTYYSYDIQGNVNFVIQDLPMTNTGNTRLFGQTSYEYDLVSKKVKKVSYNFYESDSHIQEYKYDEDNRLRKVRTSRYGYLWEEDSRYKYYPHGPLARVELGHDYLQGVDYTYTIQGWLKGINNLSHSQYVATTKDPGKDGAVAMSSTNLDPIFHYVTAYDGYSEVLNYFNGDFSSYSNLFNNNDRLNSVSGFGSLFNGNIASWESNYTTNKPSNTTKIDNIFTYDYLNRLKTSTGFNRTQTTTGGNIWSSTNDKFDNSYAYDANGNITTLKRKYDNSGTAQLDDLTYTYNAGSNKLNKITDAVSTASPIDYDLESQGDNNYNYDPSGNLTSDLSEGIMNMTWTVDGKVKTVPKATGTISYLYDASGNRVMKRVPNSITGMINYTLYARDANNQVMAVYKRDVSVENDNTDPAIGKCITIRFQIPTMDCYATVTLCNSEYTLSKDGELTVNTPKTVYCAGFPWVPIVLLAQTTFPTFNRDKYTTQGGIINPYTTNGRVDGAVGLSITVNGGGATPTTGQLTGGSISITSGQDLMPKLAEWHIYGNEQQGRFVTRKPETEPCYYLGGVTNDVANLNFFRILDKKEYELKDHLGNVRVAIGDMKLPENEATSTRGVPPFVTDEKTVNDYYPFGMTIADRSWQSTDYRYGYNMQEKSTEIDPFGNHNTAEFWEYDTRSARRWNLDPKPTFGVSQYSTFANNPIMFSDYYGDSINLGNLYDKDKNGNLKRRSDVQAFEAFAMSSEGKKWILDRAQSGFKLQGEIYKDLNINVQSEGSLSKKGIDYNINSSSDNYTNAFVSGDRLKINVKFSSTHPDYFPRFFSATGALLHETFYHGNIFELQFLNHTYKTIDVGGKNFIDPSQTHQHYSSLDENKNKNLLRNLRNSMKYSLYGQHAFSILSDINIKYNFGYKNIEIYRIMQSGFWEYYGSDITKLTKLLKK